MTFTIVVSRKILISALIVVVLFALFIAGSRWVSAQGGTEYGLYTIICVKQDGSLRVVEDPAGCKAKEMPGALVNAGQFVSLSADLANERTNRMAADTAFDARIITLENRVIALENLLAHFSRSGDEIHITGANLHVVNGLDDTETTNGLGNIIIGYNELRSGQNDRTGSHMLVAGKYLDYSSYGGLVVGQSNETSGAFSSVSAGSGNTASGDFSSVSGGGGNVASSIGAAVSGGHTNTASGWSSSVSGGQENEAIGTWSTVSGGYQNESVSLWSAVSGGGHNRAGDPDDSSNGFYSAVSGGWDNHASANSSSVSGGHHNWATGPGAAISGGDQNRAQGDDSSISGGFGHTVISQWNWAAGGLFESQ
ncbi:MAG: hypothetical protein WA996_07095 [Candidatus Promineifilaceae bacterium]